MRVRPAESTDRNSIRATARASLQSSYSLSPQQIETILQEEFDDTSLTQLLDDPDTSVLVADRKIDGREQVFGFATVQDDTQTTIRWLHVDPEARGEGIATALFDRVREGAAGRPVGACILEAAAEGGEFVEGFGLEQRGHDQITVGGEEFAVTIFTESETTKTADELAVRVPDSVTVEGEHRTVDQDDKVPGREAPFFRISSVDETGDTYGYVCSQCGSRDVAAEGLDRLGCGNCSNAHLADNWDEAYL